MECAWGAVTCTALVVWRLYLRSRGGLSDDEAKKLIGKYVNAFLYTPGGVIAFSVAVAHDPCFLRWFVFDTLYMGAFAYQEVVSLVLDKEKEVGGSAVLFYVHHIGCAWVLSIVVRQAPDPAGDRTIIYSLLGANQIIEWYLENRNATWARRTIVIGYGFFRIFVCGLLLVRRVSTNWCYDSFTGEAKETLGAGIFFLLFSAAWELVIISKFFNRRDIGHIPVCEEEEEDEEARVDTL